MPTPRHAVVNATSSAHGIWSMSQTRCGQHSFHIACRISGGSSGKRWKLAATDTGIVNQVVRMFEGTWLPRQRMQCASGILALHNAT